MEIYPIRPIRFIGPIGLICLIGFLAAPTPTHASSIPKISNNLGLVGYWSMEDGSGTSLTDHSGNGNTGTLTNMEAADWTTGKIGKALTFDGVDEYVDVAHNAALNPASTDFTISAWMKTGATLTSDSNLYYIAEKGIESTSYWSLAIRGGSYNGIFFRLRQAGPTVIEDLTPSSDISSTVVNNQWHHIVVTVDEGSGTEGRLYFDGQQVGTLASFTANVNPSGTLTFGKYNTPDGQYWNGSIDEVRVYNRALSATEVAALYNSSKSTKINKQPASLPSGLVGYWRMDEGSGTSASDKSGNNAAATLTNGPTWITGKYGSSVNFDGVNDYVDAGSATAIDDLALGANGMTYSAWVYPKSVGETAGRIGHKRGTSGTLGGWNFYVIATNAIGAGTVSSAGNGTNMAASQSANNSISFNAWSHVAFTYNDTGDRKVHLFVNGTEVSYASQTTATVSPGSDANSFLSIGNAPDTTRTFNGYIDDVRVYNRALSADEVMKLYNGSAITVNASKNTVAPSSLVAWHTFDGPYLNTTTSTDRSGQANNGTLTGGPTPVSGKLGQALNFDGSDDYVNVADADALTLSSGFTISAWIYPTLLNNYHELFNKDGTSGREFGTAVDLATDKLTFFVTDNTAGGYRGRVGGTALSVNTWYHVTFIYDGGTTNSATKIYLNGVQDDATDYSTGSFTSIRNTAADFRIGAYGFADYLTYMFRGSIDDVRIYNKTLSAAEVLQLYNMGK